MDFRLGDLHARIATLEREKDALAYRNTELTVENTSLRACLGDATEQLQSLQTQVAGAQAIVQDVLSSQSTAQPTLYQDVEDDLGQWR